MKNKWKIGQKIAENQLEVVGNNIAKELAAKYVEIVKEHIVKQETLDGNFSQTGLWRLKQKLCPVTMDPPMAKQDDDGNIITASKPLKKLYLDTYARYCLFRGYKAWNVSYEHLQYDTLVFFSLDAIGQLKLCAE